MALPKHFHLAFILFAVLAARGWAAPYAPQEFDFGDLGSLDIAYGVVQRVQEVPLDSDPSSLDGLFEHPLKPETGSQISIQLQDGRLLNVMQEGTERFESGQRVQVIFTTDGIRVDPR